MTTGLALFAAAGLIVLSVNGGGWGVAALAGVVVAVTLTWGAINRARAKETNVNPYTHDQGRED